MSNLFDGVPEGTTHRNGCVLYKFTDDAVFIWVNDHWAYSAPPSAYDDGSMNEIISRPKPWSGPEDGLPPVGTVCEYSLGDSNCWYVCEIKYVLRDGDGLVAECHLKPSIEQYLNTYQGTECLATFRAIKSNQHIESDTRETAIRELMDIAQVDCRVTAARLVDAGFKREVV